MRVSRKKRLANASRMDRDAFGSVMFRFVVVLRMFRMSNLGEEEHCGDDFHC